MTPKQEPINNYFTRKSSTVYTDTAVNSNVSNEQ